MNTTLVKYSLGRESFVGQFVEGKLVLDIGCGYGNIAYHLKNWGAKEIIGIDTSVERIDFANKNYRDANLTFALMDAHELAFRAGGFDVVYSLATVEHVSNPSRFFRECYRVLKPGGIFICSAVNKYRSLLSKSEHARREHKREYSPEGFGNLVRYFFAHTVLYYQGKLGRSRYVVKPLNSMPSLLIYHILTVSEK